jgi:RNA polymerase sigma factor (sigma-70 family)
MPKFDNPPTDHELLKLLKQGDTYAFDELYNRYWRSLFSTAYNRLGDEDTAKDIVQTLLINVWQKRHELHITTTLSQYLFGAVKLKILQHFRSENVKQSAIEKALDRMNDLFYTADALSGYLDLEKIVSEEVEVMPVNMKRSFLLRSDSYSVKEIAENLNLAEQTVSNNITEALKRLKRRLKVEYPDRYMNCFIIFTVLLTKN